MGSDQRWCPIACILLFLGALVLWLCDVAAISRVHVGQKAQLLWAQPIESAKEQILSAPVETPLHRCDYESGPSSSRHEEWANRLDGRRIVFIGDSITRYQYLELGYYLSHGLCPSAESEYGYIIKEQDYTGWDEFYRNTSAALSTASGSIKAHELCLCNRDQLTAHMVNEHRHYVYEDIQGRRIELVYLQYFIESFDRLKILVSMADATQPTDVLVNFGWWMKYTRPSCGAEDGQGDCPYIPWVCEYFQTKSPYRKFWLTTTPVSRKKTSTEELVPESHHLHIPSRCNFTSAQMLDRGNVLKTMQPDDSLRHKLYTDNKHMTAVANHAFNQELVNQLPKKDASKPKSSENMYFSHTWKPMFGF